MKEILRKQNSQPFLRQVSPASLPNISAGYCQRAVVDELGKSRTQMGTHNRSVMVAVLGAPYAIPPRNSNSRSSSSAVTLSTAK
jgi:hypothetical protein